MSFRLIINGSATSRRRVLCDEPSPRSYPGPCWPRRPLGEQTCRPMHMTRGLMSHRARGGRNAGGSANNSASSLANGIETETAYYYDGIGCTGARVSLGPGLGDHDLDDGTGYRFNDRVSSFARGSRIGACENDI